MTKRKTQPTFEPGKGYTREDWDAVDSPELTAEEIRQLKPAREVSPPEFFKSIEQLRRARKAGLS